jgi:hypothetical protein
MDKSDSCQDFRDGGLLLTKKLLNQGFLLVKLKSSLRMFYGRHHDLVDRYGTCVTNDHGYVSQIHRGGVSVMVFYATFSTISVVSSRSVLLVEETGILGENYRPVASH